MGDPGAVNLAVSILDVLAVWPCAHGIFELVRVRDVVRSERVSRDWQHAVHDYLRGRTLSFVNAYSIYSKNSRVIGIPDEDRSWPTVCKVLKKLGCHIVQLFTDRCDEEYLNTIAVNCPNLQHIEFSAYTSTAERVTNFKVKFKNCKFDIFSNLKQISLKGFQVFPDQQLDPAFQTADCEKIEIENTRLTGSFLKNMKSNNLRSLSVSNTPELDIDELLSFNSLQNLRCLELNRTSMKLFSDIHLLLNKIPKLEELSLRSYDKTSLSKEFIDSFRGLENLKRLDLRYNRSVNTDLLVALAQGCQQLEFLRLTAYPTDSDCARGIETLCLAPPAVTTVCLEYVRCADDDLSTSEHIADYLRKFPVVRELELMGIVEVTPQLLEASSHSGRRGKWLLILPARCTMYEAGASQRDLKIIIN